MHQAQAAKPASNASQQRQQHQQKQHKAATGPEREHTEYKHDSKNATKNLAHGLKITKILFIVDCYGYNI